MLFNANAQSSVFDNPDLLREIGQFIEPRLPMYFVFHSAREAFLPLEKIDKSGLIKIRSSKRSFACSVSLIIWAKKEGCDFFTQRNRFGKNIATHNIILEHAAGGGYLDVIKWLVDLPVDPPITCTPRTLYEASNYGHLEVLKYLRSKFPDC